MAMMISWVELVNPSHPYLENDQLRRLTPTICAFHLGFSLGTGITTIFALRRQTHPYPPVCPSTFWTKTWL